MKALRDPRSIDVIGQETAPFDLSSLTGHRYILLVTARRDGRPIATPMWFASDGESRVVVRSGAEDPKLRRIRRNALVEICACDVRGRPLDAPMLARARILSSNEERRAELLLKRAFGWKRSLYSVLRAPLLRMRYIEITSRVSLS